MVFLMTNWKPVNNNIKARVLIYLKGGENDMKKNYILLCNKNNYPLVVRLKDTPEIAGQIKAIIKVNVLEYIVAKTIKKKILNNTKVFGDWEKFKYQLIEDTKL